MITTRARELGELEHMIGGKDARAVERETWKCAGRGTRRDDEVAAGDFLAVADTHAVPGTVDDLAAALHDRDVAPFQQGLETRGEPVDDLLFAHLGSTQIEHRIAVDVDAEFGRVAHRAQHVRRLQQLLGRDAPPVQARATDAPFFDERDVQPRGGAVERGGIAGRSSAEDHNVEFVGQDGHLLRASMKRFP